MSNSFNKEENIAWEASLESFEDQLVLSNHCSIYNTDQVMMERSNDIIWRPVPYIAQSHDGTDATSNFDEATQLSVPATIGYSKHSTAILSATELRDALQENRLGVAAIQKLSSDINVALNTVAALQGTMVVKRTTPAVGVDDVAQIESMMNEQGVPLFDRNLGLGTRDYLGMAKDLAVNTRSFGNAKSDKAYEKGYVGPILSFDTFKMDYSYNLPAAAGGAGLTIDTRDAAVNYYTPSATSTAATGEVSNVDNRYQTITVSSTTSVVAGDAFTIADLNAVHHVTKQDTGQLKTFRVISVPSSTTLVVSPPLITNQVSSEAGTVYKNCVINVKSATSAIVFLNTVAKAANPFWQKDALELLPGRYAVPADAGVAVRRGVTKNGIELVMQKFYDINTMKTKYRWDVRFGVVNKLPEHSGIILFNQT